MRTCSAELATDIANGSTTLAHLLRITRTDGTVIRLTDASTDLSVGGFTYSADPSFTTSAIFTSSSMTASQNVTLTMPMVDNVIEEADVRAKRFSGAAAEIFLVNYADTSHGVMTLFAGKFGSIRLSDKKAISVEIIPDAAALGQAMFGVEVYQSTCRNSLGDGDCQVDIESLKVAFTVDTTTGLRFTASEFTTEPDEYFTQGFVVWATGDNAGLRSMVSKYIMVTDEITLVQAPPNAIQVGDTGHVYPGCDKLPTTCETKFSNIVNFDGEPHVPAQDYIKPIPTTTYLRGS